MQQRLHDLRLAAHLPALNHKPWLVATLASRDIVPFAYPLQAPASRIGHRALGIDEFRILLEVIAPSAFSYPFDRSIRESRSPGAHSDACPDDSRTARAVTFRPAIDTF
jgi:hypothetical protein